jgi:ABC-type bacteriocin/lantibiotic exporter with double-glycine peptidase domain
MNPASQEHRRAGWSAALAALQGGGTGSDLARNLRAKLPDEGGLHGGGDPGEDWAAVLGDMAEGVGLRVQRQRLSCRDLLRGAVAHLPLLTRGHFTPDCWVSVRGCYRPLGRALVSIIRGDGERVAWWSTRRLARYLGAPNVDVPIDWVSAEPLASLDAMRGAGHHDQPPGEHHGGHGGGGHHGLPPTARLLGLLRVERDDIWVTVVFACVAGLMALATPIAVQSLVTSVAFTTLLQPVVVLTLLLLASLLFAGAMSAMQTHVVEIIQRRLFLRVATDLGHRLPRVQLAAFDREHGPELVNRFFDVFTVQKSAASLLMDGLAVVLQILVGLVLLAFYHPLLLAFDLVLVSAMAFVLLLLGRGAARTSIAESKAKYAVAGWLEELVRHPIAFKGAGGPRYALERVDELARGYLGARQGHYAVVLRQILGGLTLQSVASALLLGLGAWLVLERQLTVGQLVAAELVVTAAVSGFAKLGKHLESYYDLLAAVDKLGHLVDLPLEPTGHERLAPDPRPARVSVREVAFHFPGEGERAPLPLWEGASFELTPASRVGLTGASGCGKSTVLDLLYALRTPTSGRISLDGADLRDVRLDGLRRQVALVRGAEVAAASVADNIRMGRAEIPLSEVRRALEEVGLLEDVLRFKEGLQTALATGGAPLSDGQVRRLVLARAIVGRPRLLLLDEALDSLGPEWLAPVADRLFASSTPWTLVVVSRRESILRRCDRLLRVEKGSIVPEERHG